MANPRLLLFGTPGAGKSSLLGALAQASATQSTQLKGELVGASTELNELRKTTYQAQVAATDDLTTYDVRLQLANGPILSATLIDCSGEAAQAMLRAKAPFADTHPLKKPVLDADGVLLVIDASISSKQMGEEFQQFARWLKDLHATLGRRAEVGDLPVYLVLAKCDLLVKPNDTLATWLQRIEDGKRRVDQRFREYLKGEGPGFGSIRLHVWATAIKRPSFADRPTKGQEPFGVAELFRDSLQSAADYDWRQAVSQSRLHNVVAGLLGALTVLGLVVSLLVQYQPEPKTSDLDARLSAVLPGEDARPADRLRGTITVLENKLKAIAAIEAEPAYGRLPQKTKKDLTDYRDEVAEYLRYYRREKETLKLPYKAKNEEEYLALEKKLNEFRLPEKYAEAWKDTPLDDHLKKMRDEYKAMNAQLDQEVAWLHEQAKKDKALAKRGRPLIDQLEIDPKSSRSDAEAWKATYMKHIADTPRTRMPNDQILPGVSARYKILDRFRRVQEARKEWEQARNELNATAASIQSRL